MQAIVRGLALGYLCLFGVLVQAENWVIPERNEAFKDYLTRAESYLLGAKQWVNEANKAQELAAVMPFELLPSGDCVASRKGVLLAHGLSDSPYSMGSVAKALNQQCLHVRVILLPGHGTKAEDLIAVSRDDWRLAFSNAAQGLATEVDQLYVGGFSTGGALALEYATQQPDKVQGALLFSPVLKINSPIDWLASCIAPMVTWLDHLPTDDYAKYASIPVPAIAEVYSLAKEINAELQEQPNSQVPVFIAMSEEDDTVDSSVTQRVFTKRLTHPMSQLIVYSATRSSYARNREKVQNVFFPEQKVLGLSHMAVHGSPEDAHYGRQGDYRVCSWYVSTPELLQQCKQASINWYGEKSPALSEKSPYAARITWNPLFTELMQDLVTFIEVNQ